MNACALIIDNRDWVKTIIEAHEKFLPKYWDVYWIRDQKTNTAQEYNQFLTSKKLWRNIPADKVLIFQHDSGLLKPGIENFLEWDFIGATIPRIGYPAMNGGLSIRDRKMMLKAIDKQAWHPLLGNEDIYFCNSLQSMGANLPNYETARKFSVETEYSLGSIGFHAIDKYLSTEKCNLIRKQYE